MKDKLLSWHWEMLLMWWPPFTIDVHLFSFYLSSCCLLRNFYPRNPGVQVSVWHQWESSKVLNIHCCSAGSPSRGGGNREYYLRQSIATNVTANVNHPIKYLFSLLAGGDIPPSAHQRGEIIATDILAGRGMGGFLSAKEEGMHPPVRYWCTTERNIMLKSITGSRGGLRCHTSPWVTPWLLIMPGLDHSRVMALHSYGSHWSAVICCQKSENSVNS